MVSPLRRSSVALALMIGGILLSACSTSVLAEPAVLRAAAERNARIAWANRPFQSYQLTVRTTLISQGGTFTCEATQRVEATRIRQVISNSCLLAENWTVDLLFDRAALSNRRACDPAGIGGCACIRTRQTTVHYDEQLGFPRSIERRNSVAVQRWHPDYWIYLLHEHHEPWCARNVGAQTQLLSVEQITPLR